MHIFRPHRVGGRFLFGLVSVDQRASIPLSDTLSTIFAPSVHHSQTNNIQCFMKRFLCAGERYALSRLKNKLYLACAITIQTSRQTRVIAVLLSLFLFIQESRANFSAPVKPTAGAVFSSTIDAGTPIFSTDSIKP